MIGIRAPSNYSKKNVDYLHDCKQLNSGITCLRQLEKLNKSSRSKSQIKKTCDSADIDDQVHDSRLTMSVDTIDGDCKPTLEID